MTVEEFEKRYTGEKPYFEYWFGEAVQKPMPTWIHALLQAWIIRLLDDAGYIAGAELTLKISPAFQPVPDVAAVLPNQIDGTYPTRPVEVVVEILSPTDRLTESFKKCAFYADLGIPNIYVVDPNSRLLWRWHQGNAQIEELLLSIPAPRIWERLDSIGLAL